MFCSSYSLNSEHILIDQMSSFSAGLKTHTLRNFAPGKKYIYIFIQTRKSE